MKVEFKNKRLELIRTDRAHELGLPIGVIKSARDKLRFIEAAPDERTLRNWRSLQFKHIDETGEKQIRLNDQYRMRFTIDTAQSPQLATVTDIGDPHDG